MSNRCLQVVAPGTLTWAIMEHSGGLEAYPVCMWELRTDGTYVGITTGFRLGSYVSIDDWDSWTLRKYVEAPTARDAINLWTTQEDKDAK